MEFKNRANYGKRSTHSPQSLSFTHSTSQAFQGSQDMCLHYPDPEIGTSFLGLNMGSVYQSPNMVPGHPDLNAGLGYTSPNMRPRYSNTNMGPGYSGPNMGHPHEFYRSPTEMREAIWRELEKEKIREEIIAEEIMRKRMLEAEVRREKMIDRELAMRIGGDGFLYSPMSTATKFEQMAERMPLEEKIGKSLEEMLGMSAMLRRGQLGGIETAPSHPQSSKLRIFRG